MDDVLNIVEQDAVFYNRSRGGVTLSGGEPLMQSEVAGALLREARRRRIKTAVETCGLVPLKTIEGASPYINSVLYDIKHMNSEVHEEQTGSPNGVILDNFKNIVALDQDRPVLARTPVVPGFNDSEEAIAAIAEFVKPFVNVRYEMLPYHRLGTQKYHFLNRKPPMDEMALDKSTMSRLVDVAIDILGDRVEVAK